MQGLRDARKQLNVREDSGDDEEPPKPQERGLAGGPLGPMAFKVLAY